MEQVGNTGEFLLIKFKKGRLKLYLMLFRNEIDLGIQ